MPRKKGKSAGTAEGAKSRSDPRPASPPEVSPQAGVDPGAVPSGRYLPLLYPGSHGVLRVRLLNDWAFGWCSHWHEGRTTPHHVDPERCPGCRAGQMPRWSAYILGLVEPTRRLGIVQISGEAWMGCAELRGHQGQLRGVTLDLSRIGGSKCGKVIARLTETAATPDLPPARDVRPLLSLYWGMQPDWLEWQCGPHRAGINAPAGKEVP